MREHRALHTILEPGGISTVYQPIIRVDGQRSLAGFEALSRGPKGTNFESAKVLFDYVRLKREETLVDRACVAAALANAPVRSGARLTVNVHASTLGRDHDFVGFFCGVAEEKGVALDHLTVEIVEHAPPWDGIGFLTALDRLRERGIRIALDDVGLGQSNFKMILDARPDYLKIDRYFVDQCDMDPNRQAVIESIASLAVRFGAVIVAEGVESEPVVDALKERGISLMQGYLFAKPMSASDAAAFGS